jgi:hypothetical protein
MRAGGDLFEVRAADATGVHSYKQFSRTDLWDGNGFQADIVDAAVYRRQHGCGGGMRLLV